MASEFSKMVAGIREEQAAAKEESELSHEGYALRERLKAQKVAGLIDKQKKAFAAAHTNNGIVYFKLIGTMIKSGEIKPPKGLDAEDLQDAYDQAIQLVAKKEFDKSAKKNR